jgi:hypothetical protein
VHLQRASTSFPQCALTKAIGINLQRFGQAWRLIAVIDLANIADRIGRSGGHL